MNGTERKANLTGIRLASRRSPVAEGGTRDGKPPQPEVFGLRLRRTQGRRASEVQRGRSEAVRPNKGMFGPVVLSTGLLVILPHFNFSTAQEKIQKLGRKI